MNLDERQAYLAMLEFLRAYMERGYSGEDLPMIMGSAQLTNDGSCTDPAYWFDWLDAIDRTLSGGGDRSLKPGKALSVDVAALVSDIDRVLRDLLDSHSWIGLVSDGYWQLSTDEAYDGRRPPSSYRWQKVLAGTRQVGAYTPGSSAFVLGCALVAAGQILSMIGDSLILAPE